MNYYWTECPRCRCHVAINWTAYPDKISGSLRRWSADRTINDGRLVELPVAALAAGALHTACLCGQELTLPATPSAVGGEREAGMRVDLGKL